MVKKTRKEKKVITEYLEEQLGLLEDSFEPSIKKSLEHMKKKFDLADINFRFRIDWKMKVIYNE